VIVLDASAVVNLLLRFGTGDQVGLRIARPGETLHAPYLLDLEVLQALRRRLLSGQLTLFRSREALEDYADLAVTRYPHLPLIDRIWQLRENASTFDAVYLSLAEALDAPLITADAALTRIPGVRVRVELFA